MAITLRFCVTKRHQRRLNYAARPAPRIPPKAAALLLDEQPDLVLLTYQSRNLVSPRLKGWEPNVRDTHSGRYISIAP